MKEPPTLISGPQPQPLNGGEAPANRFLLWVDGVGGFLVCLSNRVTLGHAAPDATVDVPILADVSRHHATLQRDPEGYFLEAIRAGQVNGQAVTKRFLHTGDRITLGSACQFVFRQNVPVSASARLDLVSGHRLWRALDGVLLMADTLVLGPAAPAHVEVADLRQPLIIYRQKDGLAVRYPGNLWVNGEPCKERGAVTAGTKVATEECVLTLEEVPFSPSPLAGEGRGGGAN